MRFRPEQHLRRQSDIRGAREEGRRFDCKGFTIWYRPQDADLRRVGVVASKAAVGMAVQRNRAKRRMREIFRRHQELLPAGCDLLLVARSGMDRRPFAEMEKKFLEACRTLSASGRVEPRS